MYNPTTSRLRDATATVRTRSPLGTPPLSARDAEQPQSDSGSPSTNPSAVNFTPTDQLDHIFQSVRQQIDRWGENAKWKLDLVLLDSNGNPIHTDQSQHPPPPAQQQPHHHHPLAMPRPSPIAPRPFPMEYAASPPPPPPAATSHPNESWQYTNELQHQLKAAHDRQRYLEDIIRSQAAQIEQAQIYGPDTNKAIETMRSVYMMAENEQKLQHLVETKMLHKNMEALSRKLKRMSTTLQNIETMKLPPEDAKLDREKLLEERKLIRRKLHLAELRLSARDAELEYLYDVVRSHESHPSSYYPHHEASPKISVQSPTPQKAPLSPSARRGTPYLFQQQYSPKMRHDIKPPNKHKEQKEQQHQHQQSQPQPQTTAPEQSTSSSAASTHSPQRHNQYLSALESLGIVADRMLSDPEFNNHPTKGKAKNHEGEPPPDAKRSKRSIDSANALLSMPNLMFPKQNSQNDDVKMEEIAETYEWTSDRDNVLSKAVEKYGTDNWEDVSKMVPNSTPADCEQRWHSRLNASESPSIAALIDRPEQKQQEQRHYSPHATPPLAPQPEEGMGPPLLPSEPGYRPPSPASTPKRAERPPHEIHHPL
ncbi:hypothetical protein BCR43DRAFT_497355 [Syncephalastrum racemosum]|uniref:Uncharacterized protein n=1 Tax=Syncephalastrum racemosum TaxID=13706 RepID=A0A1X2H209_SYNRA|nr:hypothetical protein BCR43DRAFT_497355 [Syncephalastrum racemosum]